MVNMDTIGSRIRIIMEKRGLRISDLVRGTGLPRQTIVNIIKDISPDPSVNKVRAIAEFLGIDLNYLITGKSLENLAQEKEGIVTNIKDSKIQKLYVTIGDNNIVGERRADYRIPGMRGLIQKLIKLSPESREIVSLFVDALLKKEENK